LCETHNTHVCVALACSVNGSDHARVDDRRFRPRSVSVAGADEQAALDFTTGSDVPAAALSANGQSAPAAFRLRLVAVGIVDLARELADRIGSSVEGWGWQCPWVMLTPSRRHA
jgi:hypothetical protein